MSKLLFTGPTPPSRAVEAVCNIHADFMGTIQGIRYFSSVEVLAMSRSSFPSSHRQAAKARTPGSLGIALVLCQPPDARRQASLLSIQPIPSSGLMVSPLWG